MLSNFKFHHLGYVTDNIDKTAAVYVAAGYKSGNIIIDPIQQVKVCFLEKQDAPRIELVTPLNDTSSINKFFNKNGVSPYHVCYEVNNVENVFEKLTEEMGYIPLFRPVPAVAFENKLICYLYKKEIGFIEIVNA